MKHKYEKKVSISRFQGKVHKLFQYNKKLLNENILSDKW